MVGQYTRFTMDTRRSIYSTTPAGSLAWFIIILMIGGGVGAGLLVHGLLAEASTQTYESPARVRSGYVPGVAPVPAAAQSEVATTTRQVAVPAPIVQGQSEAPA